MLISSVGVTPFAGSLALGPYPTPLPGTAMPQQRVPQPRGRQSASRLQRQGSSGSTTLDGFSPPTMAQGVATADQEQAADMVSEVGSGRGSREEERRHPKVSAAALRIQFLSSAAVLGTREKQPLIAVTVPLWSSASGRESLPAPAGGSPTKGAARGPPKPPLNA